MKGQKQSKIEVLQKKVQALTNVVKQLINELQNTTTLAEGTLTAFQLHIGEDVWKQIVEELYNKEKRENELEQ